MAVARGLRPRYRRNKPAGRVFSPRIAGVAAASPSSRHGKTLVETGRDKTKKREIPLESSSHWEDITMELTRRHALAGAAAIAAAPLLPAISAQAPPRRWRTSRRRASIATRSATSRSPWFPTAGTPFTLEDSFIVNAKKEEVDAALEKAFMPRDMLTIYFAPLVINTGGKLVVIDTGNGPLAQGQQQGRQRPVRRQHGRRRLRSQGGRHGGDLALPHRPRERPVDRRRHAGISERRSAGAGDRVEILDGRRRDEPCAGGPHGGPVQEQPQRLRGRPEEEGHAL